jgi:hypothetical protein
MELRDHISAARLNLTKRLGTIVVPGHKKIDDGQAGARRYAVAIDNVLLSMQRGDSSVTIGAGVIAQARTGMTSLQQAREDAYVLKPRRTEILLTAGPGWDALPTQC